MLFYTTLFILGLIFGSFATMASHRLPESKPLAGRSYCPKCKHNLGVFDLIPLLSFIFQKGKCQHCKAHISWRYPIIEILTGAIFVVNGLTFKDSWPLLVITCLASVSLVIIIFADLESYIIPDQSVIVLGISGILFAYFSKYQLSQVIIMPLGVTLMALFLKYFSKMFFGREALGMGDVKFFAAAALFLNPETLAGFFMASGILAFIFGLWWRILGKGEYFPFGPALSISLYLCMIFPQYISNILLI